MKRIAIVVVVLLLAAGGFWFWKHRAAETETAGVKPPTRTNVTTKLDAPDTPLAAAIVMQIADVGALRKTAEGNAWLQDVLKTPLGKGFIGAWAGFFQSTGEDLQASFRGTLLDYLLGQIVQPATLVWFTGERAPGTPAVLFEHPARPLRDAVQAIGKSAGWGEMTANRCPGEPEPKEDKPKFTLTRWLIAEQPMFVFISDERIVLASKPVAALAGACAKITPPKTDGVALSVVPEAFGREALALATLLGIEGAPVLQLDVKNGALIPRGIEAHLKNAHLVSQAAGDDDLKLVPEETPIELALALQLPQELNEASLKSYLGGAKPEGALTRQVNILWWPSDKDVGDIAILWSRTQDEAALQKIFSGRNKLRTENMCGHHVLASSSAVLDKLRDTCKGSSQHPSLQSAAPQVVSGWHDPSALTLSVHFGHLLQSLMLQSYGKSPPPEINTAATQVGALPVFGFCGAVNGSALSPKGFRS